MANRPRIEGTIDIEATPAEVWAIVSDLKRMGEWSPQCQRMHVFGGAVKQGTRTFNINKAGKMRWPTSAKVIAFDPERKLAFRILENRTIWTYELEPTANGTRLTEHRTAPDGVRAVSNLLTEKLMGGTASFETALEKGIARTLKRIKSAAEGARV